MQNSKTEGVRTPKLWTINTKIWRGWLRRRYNTPCQKLHV